MLDLFLADLAAGAFALEWDRADLGRIRELVRGYADLPLRFPEAVIACIERYGGEVLTLDARHFGIVSREGTITLLP